MALNENIPMYFKTYHRLKQSIMNGEFEKGSKIGIIADLAKRFGVAQETMRRALCLLETEGLLIKKQGFGTMIPENANLNPIQMGQLITGGKVSRTLLESEVIIYSAGWVEPSRRLLEIYNLEGEKEKPRFYRIFNKIVFRYEPGLRALMDHYLPEKMFGQFQFDESSKPFDILLKLTQWMESTPVTLKQTMRPHLCMDENARLLNLPDGTPVFSEDFFVQDKKGFAHFWDFISTANILRREVDIA